MPDPTEFPAGENELPEEKLPQQPKYDYPPIQQTPQSQPSAYNYPQPRQPQYNYPQQSYQQQQQQQGYQQQQQQQGYQQQQQQQGYQQQQQGYQQQQQQQGYQQPRYGYQQQQPYGYQQQGYQQPQYGYQQPYAYQQPYGYRQPQAAVPDANRKALGSMILMIAALALLAYPMFNSILSYLRNLTDYFTSYTCLVLISYLCLLSGLVLMLVGAIIGSRGCKLFGVGLLLCLVFFLIQHLYAVIANINFYEELAGILSLLLGVGLVTGTLLAAIGCLARVKGLKIVGGILMLADYLLVRLVYIGTYASRIGIRAFSFWFYLFFLGMLLVCIAVLVFPIRREK